MSKLKINQKQKRQRSLQDNTCVEKPQKKEFQIKTTILSLTLLEHSTNNF